MTGRRTAAPAAAPPTPAEMAVGAKSGRQVKIADRYYMIETANLKFTVKRAGQRDIELSLKP
jgi:hypothetical protein